MELNPLRVGGATALTFAVVSLVCTAAVYLFPEATVGFVNAWVHGLDLTLIVTDKPWTLGGLAYGFFGATHTGFSAGALFAVSSNLTGKCRKAAYRQSPGAVQEAFGVTEATVVQKPDLRLLRKYVDCPHQNARVSARPVWRGDSSVGTPVCGDRYAGRHDFGSALSKGIVLRSCASGNPIHVGNAI